MNEHHETARPIYPLPPELDSVWQRFEAAWQNVGEEGTPPAIETFLAEVTGRDRVALLHELVALDVLYRRRRGGVPTFEEYACRFAELNVKWLQRELDQPSGAPTRASDSPTTPYQTSKEKFAPAFQVPGYEILGEVGRGGMGIVYRARQTRLSRDVALKRLPPLLAQNPALLQRFRNEARVAAQLTDAGIVPVYDVVELADGPVLVMPYIEGCDLWRILADRRAVRAGGSTANRHPWAALGDREYLDRVLPVLDRLVNAVAVIHRAEILHRDIKPSNVLVQSDGHVWLSDFGLARLGSESVLTSPGIGIGTPGYMSTEQWDGLDDVDGRTDIFGLGATVYAVLTLELPYGKVRPSSQTSALVPPSTRQPLLTPDFDAVVLKALEPERKDRYQTVQEFREDWLRLREGLFPAARRPGWGRRLGRRLRGQRGMAATLLLATLSLGLSVVAWIADRGPVQPVLPLPDRTTHRNVRIVTNPEGARIALVPRDSTTGEFQPGQAVRPKEKTPLTVERLPVGEYLVEAEIQGYGFHEVYREVPAPDRLTGRPNAPYLFWKNLPDGTIQWQAITIPPHNVTQGMVLFRGGGFTMGSKTTPLVPPYRRTVPAYYLDPTEVTVGDFKNTSKHLPGRLRDKPPPDTHAISWVTFDQAMDYAEKIGKRLPDEAEYEFAATDGGKRDYPPDVPGIPVLAWSFGVVGPATRGDPQTQTELLGLFGNVAEWTTSWNFPYPSSHPGILAYRVSPEQRAIYVDDRVVRGGPYSVVIGRPDPKELAWGPRWRHGIRRVDAHPGLGFRCARSARPRFLDK